MNIQEQLAKLRWEYGMTQRALADELGMSPQKISRLERGRQPVVSQDVIRYCRYFRVSADYVLGFSDTCGGQFAAGAEHFAPIVR